MTKQRPQPKGKERPELPEASGPSPAVVSSAPTPHPSGRRSTYVEAVGVYEKALEALQRHDYNTALDLLKSVLSRFPEEKELHERVRLYLNICERHATPPTTAPRSLQERLYASTLAINGGRYDEAISHLRLVRDEDPDNDYALYMLAVAHAQRGEHAEAIAHLERSITLNPENRAQARQDPDLDPLRDDDAFRSTVDGHVAHEQFDPLRQRPRAAR